jgi:Protein of unknown function (DUF3147)
MHEIITRFLVGGIVVSVFALVSDVLRPKSFAGLFGAAPSVALATIGLTIGKEGVHYTTIESRSMIAGALAFFVYASFVSWFMMRYKVKATAVTMCSLPLWLGVAFGAWFFFLR